MVIRPESQTGVALRRMRLVRPAALVDEVMPGDMQ